MNISKRVIGILGAGLLLGAVCMSPHKEEPEVIDTIAVKEVHYLTDSELSKLYSLKQDIRNDTTIQLSYSDAQLMLLIGRSEGGPGLNGQLWIMRTIYNRYEAGWGDSIWSILNQNNQFAVVTNGSYKKADINNETHLALALLEMGENPTDGALYWESNTNSSESWHKKNLTFVAEVEGNLFYK